MRTAVAIALLALGLAAPAAARERTLDFQAAFVLSGAPTADLMTFPGAVAQLRWYRGPLYVAGLLAGDLAIDDRDPEMMNPVLLVGLGAGAGAHARLGAISLYAGGRAEWLNAWGWPRAVTQGVDFHDGLRLGPTAAAALQIGETWGHPFSLEASASWLWTRAGGEVDRTFDGWQVGLAFTGVLLPEP